MIANRLDEKAKTLVLLYNPSQQGLKQSPFVSIRGICVCFFLIVHHNKD